MPHLNGEEQVPFVNGQFSAPASSWNPAVPGTTIESAAYNSQLSDIETALSTCVLKDGTQTLTANIPFSGFKATGVNTNSGNTSRSEFVSGATLQDGAPLDAGLTTGSSTVYAATLTPAITAYADKQCFRVKFDEACGANPTINFNSVGAKKLYKMSAGTAVQFSANGIQANDVGILRYDTALDGGSGGFLILNISQSMPTVSRSSDTVLSGADIARAIIATGSFTQTFASAATLGLGWLVGYRNDGSGLITLEPDGSETINGAANLVLNPGDSATIISDGANLKTLGLTIGGFKVVTGITRDLSLANGNLSITGAGFTPRVVFVCANVGAVGSAVGSVAFGIGRSASEVFGIANLTNISAGSWGIFNDKLFSLALSGVNQSEVDLVSLDSDGCTISFTKVASPTGTANFAFLFMS